MKNLRNNTLAVVVTLLCLASLSDSIYAFDSHGTVNYYVIPVPKEEMKLQI